jgi:hypothetical protein
MSNSRRVTPQQKRELLKGQTAVVSIVEVLYVMLFNHFQLNT